MIKVINAGLQSVIEDWPGRPGYNGQGMGPSGAMDNLSLQMGNLLLGNALTEAAVEIPAGFFSCKFEKDTVIAITGGNMSPTLNDAPAANWESIFVKAGDVLKMGNYKDGFRTYLNVAGGIDVPPYLGSKSTCMFGNYGGFDGRALKPNDVLKTGTANYAWPGTRKIKAEFIPKYETVIELRAVVGMNACPDFATEKGMDYLFSHEFPVSLNANRSAIRLEALPDWFFSRESGGVGGSHPSNIVDHAYNIRGGLNVTGNTPSLLTADGPTLGGFICVLNVVNADLWKIGQAVPGKDILKFTEVSVDEAVRLRKERREMLTERIVV
ncbi:MAG: biotin-dependent carboxyltransferase family protein [Clostridiales Family XIII bacterium]|jgi:biotin-dependent carboxylase-like uncharacterized protein|nr:biotin-dependent carboxyltransferase family protein [Clostridiales Family XIII bacterium]